MFLATKTALIDGGSRGSPNKKALKKKKKKVVQILIFSRLSESKQVVVTRGNFARQLDHSDFNSVILLIHLANLQQKTFSFNLNFPWIP